MSWDHIFESLEQEYGRPPKSDEVQERILEIFSESLSNESSTNLSYQCQMAEVL